MDFASHFKLSGIYHDGFFFGDVPQEHSIVHENVFESESLKNKYFKKFFESSQISIQFDRAENLKSTARKYHGISEGLEATKSFAVLVCNEAISTIAVGLDGENFEKAVDFASKAFFADVKILRVSADDELGSGSVSALTNDYSKGLYLTNPRLRTADIKELS